MQRKLVLLLLAGAAVWVGALLDLGPRTQPIAGAEPAAADASEAPVPSSKAEPTSVVSRIVRAAQGTVAVIGNTARALLTGGRPEAAQAPRRPAAPQQRATGELGEGVLSPDYADAERAFASEPRDGSWAPAEEQRVRALFQRQPWADRVSLLNCQRSLCRIVLETGAQNPWQQLLGVPGLTDATGIAASTPYSLRSGQLSVYFTPPGAERASAN